MCINLAIASLQILIIWKKDLLYYKPKLRNYAIQVIQIAQRHRVKQSSALAVFVTNLNGLQRTLSTKKFRNQSPFYRMNATTITYLTWTQTPIKIVLLGLYSKSITLLRNVLHFVQRVNTNKDSSDIYLQLDETPYNVWERPINC